jgi:hypothetical protein
MKTWVQAPVPPKKNQPTNNNNNNKSLLSKVGHEESEERSVREVRPSGFEFRGHIYSLMALGSLHFPQVMISTRFALQGSTRPQGSGPSAWFIAKVKKQYFLLLSPSSQGQEQGRRLKARKQGLLLLSQILTLRTGRDSGNRPLAVPPTRPVAPAIAAQHGG